MNHENNKHACPWCGQPIEIKVAEIPPKCIDCTYSRLITKKHADNPAEAQFHSVYCTFHEEVRKHESSCKCGIWRLKK